MKNIYVILIVAISLYSCQDYLDEELTGGVTAEGIYSNPQGINAALNSTYSSFTNLVGNNNNREDGWTLLTLGTDTYTNASDGGNKSFNRYDGDLHSDKSILRDSWDQLYQGINIANTVLTRAPDVIEDASELEAILGQAHFLRAYYYFWLVRQYGNIHYSDEETIGPETEVNLLPVAEIYEKIVADLKLAELELSGVQVDLGRATVWAVKMALAEVYLTMEEYDLAAAYAEDVINNSGHALLTSVKDVFAIDNQNNSEIIFAFQFANDELYNGGGNPAHMFFLMEYDKLNGMVRDTENGRPWKRFKPTNYLLDLYDLEDERYDATFKTVYYVNNLTSAAPGAQIGDTAVWLPRVALTQTQKDTRPFSSQIYNQDEHTLKIFPSSNKWVQPNRLDKNQSAGDRDFIVYRTAEAYLIAAEANILKPNPDQGKASQYLDKVRARAYNGATLPAIGTVTLDIILEERAKEFAQEGKRWFDLVRTGKLVERVQMYNPEGGVNIKDYHTLRPIPLRQIDRTSNDYPQNTGY